MSIKSKVLAAAATLTLVSGVGAAGALTAGTASAATPSCGPACINLFSHQFGSFTARRTTRLTCCGRARRPASRSSCSGRRTTTRRWTGPSRSRAWCPTSSRPAWCPPRWRCTTAASRGLRQRAVNNAATVHTGGFPDDPAFENEYAPFGVESGLCMGVAATAFSDEGVTLQPCGVSSKTVWILDTYDQFSFRDAFKNGYSADQRFGHELLPAVRAELPEPGFPDRQAASAARRPQPDRFLQRFRWSPAGHHQQQPALGRDLRCSPLGSLNSHPE